MRALSLLRANPKRVLASFFCVGALALNGGERVVGSSVWQLGDLVVCGTANGQCTIYDGAGANSPSVISIPSNPKRDLGGVAWLSSFDLLVADATNKKVVRFSREGAHAGTVVLDTGAYGTPGPLVVDSAGNLFVGMSDTGTIVRRAYDDGGTTVIGGIGGGVKGMDLADDHSSLWVTSTGPTLSRLQIGAPTATSYLLTGTSAGDVRVIPGSSQLLVAVGNRILQVDSAAPATEVKPFDLNASADEVWRALALEPNGDFLATTAAGAIYRFALAGSGSPTTTTPLIATGSTKVTSLTELGGPQLNIRPIRFKGAGTDVHKEGVFGNPAGLASTSFARHRFGLRAPTVGASDDYIVAVSATWVKGDGVCDPLTPGDYDCRLTSNFDTNPLPRCIPYVTGNDQTCAFYRLEHRLKSTGQNAANWLYSITPTQLSSLIRYIDYHLPEPTVYPGAGNALQYEALYGSPKGNPRILWTLMNNSAFTDDITIGLTRTSSDPLFGEGRGGSDYGAFDRVLEGTIGGLAAAKATILQPVDGGVFQTGRSVPFEVSVLKANGDPVLDAVLGDNSMTLTVELLGTPSAIYLHPQETPGGSPEFFQLTEVKSGKTTSYVYRGNFDLSGKPPGNYVACVLSTNTVLESAGQFAPQCVGFTVRAK